MFKISKSKDFIKLIGEKKWFLFAVYMLLVVELFITYGSVYYLRRDEKLSKLVDKSIWIYFILMLILIFILVFLPPQTPSIFRIIIFTIYSLLTGILLHNMSKIVPEIFITQILISTITLFIVLSVVAIFLAYIGIELGWMQIFILLGIIAILIGYLILFVFIKDEKTKKSFYKYLIIFGLILFSFDILVSTNVMLNKNYNNNFVMAAIDLYLDIINIFVKLFILESYE